MNPINSELDRVGDELCGIRGMLPKQDKAKVPLPTVSPNLNPWLEILAPSSTSTSPTRQEPPFGDLTIVVPVTIDPDTGLPRSADWPNHPELILSVHRQAEFSPDCTVIAQESGKNKDDSFRALICRCQVADNLTGISITVRGNIKTREARPEEIKLGYGCVPKGVIGDNNYTFDSIISGMVLARECFDDNATPIDDYFKPPYTKNKQMDLRVAEGLVLISGSTGAAKSMIARSMIAWYLGTPRFGLNPKRRPHLLTLENPVEKTFYPKEELENLYGEAGLNKMEQLAQDHFVDCTHRTVGHERDVETLEKALEHAKRQTPAIVYVGEVRTSREWRAVIEFAATGHLIITTGHASTLSEAMNKIFMEAGAANPAARGRLASRISAVIHLENQYAKINGKTQTVLLPKMWRSVRAAASKLVADGLGSLIPGQYEVLGRKDMVERLLKAHKILGGRKNTKMEACLISLATQHDLNGI